MTILPKTDLSTDFGSGKKPLRFASVCDGISAVGCAWKPLGWQFVFKSEIEPFPSAVADHHHPEAPNLGDMTNHNNWTQQDYGIDLICGGTPCQAFSVAGLRKGLDDPRGNLTLTFLAVIAQFRPRWVVWENVPGVLSDKTGAFGSFLGGLGQLGYGFAYRILDAQYYGVAQRRRRVFVVGHAGGLWQRAAAVLFERDCLSGNPAPRRATGQGFTYDAAPCLGASGRGVERAGETRGQDPVIAIQEIGKRQSGNAMNGVGHSQPGDPMFCLQAKAIHGVCAGNDARAGRMRGREGCEGGGKGPLLSPEKSLTLAANANDQVLFQTCHTLRADGFDASEDGTGRGTPIVPEICGTIQADTHPGSYSGQDATTGRIIPALGFTQNQCGDILTGEIAASLGTSQNATGRNTAKACVNMAVRRLTPRECERLQGFPDDYTLIQFRKKPAADGPRYKALGNSMAVPVMRWIGERIQQVEDL
jgi:DNA (cytosine-5)-methyltransferase 1